MKVYPPKERKHVLVVYPCHPGGQPGQPKPPAGSEAWEFFVSYEGPAVGFGSLGGKHTFFFCPKGSFVVFFFCQKEILLWDFWEGIWHFFVPLNSCLFYPWVIIFVLLLLPQQQNSFGVAFRSSSLAIRGRNFGKSRALGAGSLKSVCFSREIFPKKCCVFFCLSLEEMVQRVVFLVVSPFHFRSSMMMMKKDEGWRMKDKGWTMKDKWWRMKDLGQRIKDEGWFNVAVFSLGGDPPAPFKIHSSRRVLRKTSWSW